MTAVRETAVQYERVWKQLLCAQPLGEAMKVYDKSGKVHIDQPQPPEGAAGGRPEINRSDLRRWAVGRLDSWAVG